MTGILETNPFNVDGTILHIGAGQCSELENYLDTPASAIVLLEPNPDDARILKQRARQHKRVKVISAAVSDSDGKATLYLCNDERFNGVVAPEKFSHQLPGLQALATPKVATMTIASLLETLSLAKEKTHCLVIEARGAEETILRSLKEVSGHPVFEHIVIYTSTAGAVDQTNITSSSLLAKLSTTGYRVAEVTFYQKGYFVYSAIKDALLEVNSELQHSLDSIKEENRKAKEENQNLKEQLKLTEKLQSSNGTLQQQNRQLKAENEEFQQRQMLLEEELGKAEIQLELIKELFLSKEDEEQLETKEREE